MVPMIIVVRIGLGLAYQGASSSSTPYHRRNDNNYHDPSSSSAPSSGLRQNNRQLSTFKAASNHDEGLQSISSSSTRTRLDIVKGSSESSRDGGLCTSGTDGGEKEGGHGLK